MNNSYAERSGESRAKPTPADKKGPFQIPIEIWIEILTMAVGPDRLCYDYCNSFDSPRFHNEWKMMSNQISSVFTDAQNWISQLRLVCRLWSVLIEPTWRPYLITTNFGNIGSYKNIRALSVKGSNNRVPNAYNSYSLDESLLGATRNINTLVVSSMGSDFVEFLFSQSRYFQSLRSLSYISNTYRRPDFWMRLENAFPHLTALTLIGEVPEGGSITLLDLEILHLYILQNVQTPPHFYFPSLKHYSSDYVVPSASCTQIFHDYGKNIESILLPMHDLYEKEFFVEGFWTRFPKLQLLGARSTLSELPPPPLGHPFNHLHHNTLNFKRVRILIRRLQGLCYFSQWYYPPHTRAPELVLIDEFLVSRGATRLEIHLYGENVPPEVDQLRRQGPWEKETHHPWTGVHRFLFMWEFKSKRDNHL